MMGFIQGDKPDYLGWMIASSVWGIVLLIGTYVFCTTFCKPKAGEMNEISPDIIKNRLKELGPMTSKEKGAIAVLVFAMVMWITTTWHGIDAGTVAVLALAFLAIGGLFTVQDVAKLPWPLMLFIATLLTMATQMSSQGVSIFIAKSLSPILSPLMASPWIFIPILCIITYLIRFVVISATANLAIMAAIFGPVMVAEGWGLFVLAFVVYNCGSMWNVPYQNPLPLGALAAAGGKYVTFKEFRYASVAFMIMCLIGMTASIPLWKMLGMIP
jgi:DASS family divalent anion:Na+ symporter